MPEHLAGPGHVCPYFPSGVSPFGFARASSPMLHAEHRWPQCVLMPPKCVLATVFWAEKATLLGHLPASLYLCCCLNLGVYQPLTWPSQSSSINSFIEV